MKLATICEASADRTIAQDLVDRTVIESVEWAKDGVLNAMRTWYESVNANGQTWILEWTNISRLAQLLNIKIHGHFNGESGEPDAAISRRAVLVLQRVLEPDAVFLIRDADNQPIRRNGLEQARQHFANHRVRIVIGLANAEREAWVLSGFVPFGETEEARFHSERKNLGFDPTVHSERLNSGRDDTAKKSPKRVLKFFSNDSREREAECWQSTSLNILKEHGTENGLKDFLEEIESLVVPLFNGRSLRNQ